MPLIFKHPGAQRFRMPWGAAVGAGISLVGSQMQDNKNGGAGTSTNTKEPWLPAQGWIMDNLNSGQALQAQYAKNPQSVEQQNAASNIYGQSDYMRNLVPSLLGQIGQQQVGFDPSNPTAKPKAWNWDGLLGGAPDLNQTGVRTAPAAAPAAPAAAPVASGLFTQETTDPQMAAFMRALGKEPTAGGYGSFKYGDEAAPVGSQKYLDQQMYLLAGGVDPRGLYRSYGNANGMGAATDDGGAAAAVGSSANF